MTHNNMQIHQEHTELIQNNANLFKESISLRNEIQKLRYEIKELKDKNKYIDRSTFDKKMDEKEIQIADLKNEIFEAKLLKVQTVNKDKQIANELEI